MADLTQPSQATVTAVVARPARPLGAERDALADEARSLARQWLNALRARGYPGLQLVTILVHNPFTMQTKHRRVPAWKISRSGIDADGEADEAVWWLLADGEFAVGAQDGVLHKRQPEELPALAAVVSALRALASDQPPMPAD
jgi:hypothetical protein